MFLRYIIVDTFRYIHFIVYIFKQNERTIDLRSDRTTTTTKKETKENDLQILEILHFFKNKNRGYKIY